MYTRHPKKEKKTSQYKWDGKNITFLLGRRKTKKEEEKEKNNTSTLIQRNDHKFVPTRWFTLTVGIFAN